ncbi:hypothetical protein [Streptomyces atratus]|uniref:hypothetical protein n=1 Tax=Streptomyces atratus TaxID=1893 RepID=UPI002883034C|nr:hypothetical protein [Streptomyces atratus]
MLLSTTAPVARGRTASARPDSRQGATRRPHRCTSYRSACGATCLDHVAARTAQNPALDDETARAALRTAAECSLGALSVGCFPNGDQEIGFPLIDEQLSSENIAFNDVIEQAPTAQTWLTTFTTCLISGLMWDRQRGIGLLLRSDYAPAIREGLLYSALTSTS